MKTLFNTQRSSFIYIQLLFLLLLIFSYTTVNAQSIRSIEYFFDDDPGFENGISIGTEDNTGTLTQNLSIPISNLTQGFHSLSIRVQDNNTIWSLYDQRRFYLFSTISTNNINTMEYWFNTDPGIGSGTAIAINGGFSPEFTQNTAIPLGNLPIGFNTLNVRARNANGTWGLFDQTSFFVLENPGTTNDVSNLAALEYWFDEDPGFGNGASIPFTGNPDEVTGQDITIPLSGLASGFHSLGIRAQNIDGNWSLREERKFYVFKADANTVSPIVEELEFSAREELVFGTGQTMPITATGNPDEFIVEIPADMLTCTTQNIWVSLKNSDGNYALYSILVDVDVDNLNAAPVIEVFNNIEVELDANGQGTLSIDDVDNGTSDCDLETVFITPANPTYSCNNLGTNVVTITATDETGLSTSEAVSITVVDDIDPTVIAQDITVQLDDTGTVSITTADIDNGSTDNCGISSMSLDVDTFTIPGSYPVTLTVTDGSNNVGSETVIVTVTLDSTLSIDEVLAKSINLYPNPAQNTVTIELPEALQIVEIFTLSGRKIFTTDKTTFDISNFSTGVYAVKITTVQGKTAVKQLIKN